MEADRAGVSYRLRQSFRYEYDRPALSLLHRLVVVPPRQHLDQRLRLGSVTGSDDSAQVDWSRDGFGNAVCSIRLERVPRAVELHVAVAVDRHGPVPLLAADLLDDPRLREPSLLTLPSPDIALLAAGFGRPDPLESAALLCRAVQRRVAYVPGATSVRTTAAQALAGGQGVCQDQAHVMLSALRVLGVACRYVSGHLVGQGGTHAWVEVLVPDGRGARAVGFDPCHGRGTDHRYVTVAVGRDYSDVPPTSGWYSGSARGTLSSSRELLRTPA